MPTSRWHGCRPRPDVRPWPCPRENAPGTVRRSCRLPRDEGQNNGKNKERDNEDEDRANWPDDGGDGALGRYPVVISCRHHEQRVLPQKDRDGHEAGELAERCLGPGASLELE